MADMPPIVIQKKVVHEGHHGGAWKVAYADFVTAMMALFIVLWLLNTSKQVQEAVGGYFKDPTGHSKKVGNGENGSGDNFVVTRDNMDKIKDELTASVRKMNISEKLKQQIEMTITAEGLRIELMETDKGAFFSSGAPEPNDEGRELLASLAAELGKLPNQVSIEGHTDAKPFAGGGNYGNWELSSDRANAARRVMQQNGLGPRQVTQVRGFADQRLRKPQLPEDASNRRISLIVQYVAAPGERREAGRGIGAGHGRPGRGAGRGAADRQIAPGATGTPRSKMALRRGRGGLPLAACQPATSTIAPNKSLPRYIQLDIIKAMRAVRFLGDSLKSLRDFPEDARHDAGYQLDKVQRSRNYREVRSEKTRELRQRLGRRCGHAGAGRQPAGASRTDATDCRPGETARLDAG